MVTEKSLLFSVIIPTFNAKSFINRAIDSVLRQRHVNFEILVLDGLSDDGTVAVLEKYQDSRLKFISEKDFGIYDAMNKGIDRASGEWLYFLGGDDMLHDDCVLSDVARFINFYGKSAEVVYGNVQIIGCNHWANDGDIYDGKFDLQKILKKNLCHQGIFYRTDFIRNKIGYYNLKYTLCADWDFNLRCWARTTFLHIERIIADFKAGGESTKNSSDVSFSADYLKNILSYFNFDLFDSEINRKTFLQYGKLLALQKNKRPVRWFFFRLKSKLKDLVR